MSGADKAAAIREKAERLAGRSLGENGDALTEMAMERACAWCGREDIPEAMEQAVAALLLDMEGREAAVKSVTRGDTSVTYAVADGQAAALAKPWRTFSPGHMPTVSRRSVRWRRGRSGSARPLPAP